MKQTLPLAYSYMRFSNPSQADGDSLRRQNALRTAWLARGLATLDTSLTLHDKGVSGYTGAHRSNPDRHALAAFMVLVNAGRIARGSYLIVENLDRLSREDIIPALSLLLELIQAGIRVVQLLPVEAVYDEKCNPMTLMMAIMELSRGHSESAMKSERIGAAWREKKRKAADDLEILTARAPAWLRLVGGVWELDLRAADIVRTIYRMAVDGYGLGAIAHKLNGDGVPSIGRADHWPRSYVHKILLNRAAMGEYQPCKGRGAKRKNEKDEQIAGRRPDGKPIPGYYPALVSEEEWYAAQAALESRRGKAGRPAKDRINLFAGLLHDARDGGSLQLVNKGFGPGLVSYKSVQGIAGARFVSFPFNTFTEALLECLDEIDPSEILPRKDKGANKTMALAGRLVEVDAEIERVKGRLQSRYSDGVADVLQRHEVERADLNQQLAAARRLAASPALEAWGEYRSLSAAIKAVDVADADDARVRLRAAIRRIVEGIWCLFVAHGSKRIAAVQVFFVKCVGEHRQYMIVHQATKANAAARTEGGWDVTPLAPEFAAPAGHKGALDLRRREDAAEMEKVLTALKSWEAFTPSTEGEGAGEVAL